MWNLVESPEGCKWTFKQKIDMEGNVITYKAKLIAKGYRQRQGIDYDKIFSPSAMLKSKRILLSIVAHYGYDIWQIDVKMAFRKGNLSKDVYITQPEVFTPRNGNKVCKLHRSIYGLKQTSRSRKIQFGETIKEFVLSQNANEACVYMKVSGSAVVFLVLYVDNILLVGNNVSH